MQVKKRGIHVENRVLGGGVPAGRGHPPRIRVLVPHDSDFRSLEP